MGRSSARRPTAADEGTVRLLVSFRNRLTLFFVLIVLVPMVSVAFVLFSLIRDNEQGKADARIAANQRAAINLSADARRRADVVVARLGRDPQVAAAIRAQDAAALRRRLELVRRQSRAVRVVFEGEGVAADVGAQRAVFGASRELLDTDRARVGRIEAAVADAVSFARLVRQVTGLDVVVARGGRVLAATLDGSGAAELPAGTGDVAVQGLTYRAATFTTRGADFGAPTAITLLDPGERLRSDTTRSRLLAGGILAGFLVLAFTFALLVSRSLQRQIDSFLVAARRLGEGDFRAEVPTQGRDEFAALGGEFNKMSRQLEQRLDDLAQERARLELAIQRIGETFAANLDRDGLLDIVVSTAVDGVGALGGRALIDDGTAMQEVATSGEQDGEDLDAAVAATETEVLRSAEPAGGVHEGVAVLSHPLRAGAGGHDGPGRVIGLVSIWRRGEAFGERQRELFHYLAGQAAVSIENVGLHETVERQAVTDELTGLANRRRFQEALGAEVERSRRFGQEVGLVLLDIDDFKRVNDAHGHQQGDVVLREVAQVLRRSSREIDVPARYGGEELAMVLPGTSLEGAYNLAERVRQGIEALELDLPGGQGTLRITASMGVAAQSGPDADERGLVAAADEALYEAKRAGKNRTVRAP
jgi:diguanylate cyclase (GGDEF)-like protein